jgi:hypothetical protein
MPPGKKNRIGRRNNDLGPEPLVIFLDRDATKGVALKSDMNMTAGGIT